MYVKMPNNYTLWLDTNQDYENRLKTVQRLIFDFNSSQWLKYFEECWLNERVTAGKARNITEEILDRVGTYLLQGNFRDGNILTADKEDKIRTTEIPVSSTSGNNVEDFLYSGSDVRTIHEYVNVSAKLNDGEHVKDIYDMKTKEVEKEKKREDNARKKWSESKTAKINELYTTKELDTYRVVVTGKKDLQGKPIIDTKPVHIGHKGIISGSYIACWCLVDTMNEFEFMNNRYRISDDVEQYRVGEDNKCEMERVLGIYLIDKDKYLWFDENIDPVDEAFLNKI